MRATIGRDRLMPFIDGNVDVREKGEKEWELLASVTYQGRDEPFTVPVGYPTDFASVPRLVVWLIPRYGIYTRAAILHDFLCSTAPVPRADADGIFRRAMQELGVSVPRRWLMWAAVRAASLMKGADRGQWLAFLLVAPLGLLFVAIPASVVQVFLGLFWLIELVFWAVAKAFGRTSEPVPSLQVKAA